MRPKARGESKTRARVALSWLKKVAVVIAILDLILAINDSRNVGRFFLLLTMSSTFDISPENIIRDHCRGNLEGICQNYAQFATAGTLNSIRMNGMKSNLHSGGGAGPGGRAYVEKNWSYQLFPQMFKELVMSWKSMFDQSRADANVSFYYDYGGSGGGGGMHGEQPSSSQSESASFQEPPPPPPHNIQMMNRKQRDNNQIKSPSMNSNINNNKENEPLLSSLVHRTDSTHPNNIPVKTTTFTHLDVEMEKAPISPTGSSSMQPIGGTGRKKRGLLSNLENAETGNTFGTSEPFLNANSPSKKDEDDDDGGATTVPTPTSGFASTKATTTHTQATTTNGSAIKASNQYYKGTTIPNRKEMVAPAAVSLSASGVSSSTSTSTSTSAQTQTTSEDLTTKSLEMNDEKLKVEPMRQNSLTKPQDSNINSNGLKLEYTLQLKKQSEHHSIKRKGSGSSSNNNYCKTSINDGGGGSSESPSADSSNFLYRDELGKMMSKGPKKLMGFIQEELFTRWPCLLENVQILLEQRNMSSLQLVSPEASKIKMHIEVRPFGPDPFKDSAKRLKATQQILFDYPWLTMLKLHPNLSGAFTKTFIVISVYTWVWGTLIALMLLVGSLTEDQTTLHGWMIFDILYSFLLFMIENWIDSNICPERSSVSLWLSVIYSAYKPLAGYIGFTQWYEMKKLHDDEIAKDGERYSLDCLNKRKRSHGSGSSKNPISSINDSGCACISSSNSTTVQLSPSISEGSDTTRTTKDTTVVNIMRMTLSPTTTLESTQALNLAGNTGNVGLIGFSRSEEVEIGDDIEVEENDEEDGAEELDEDYDDDDDDDDDDYDESDEEIRDQETALGCGGENRDKDNNDVSLDRDRGDDG